MRLSKCLLVFFGSFLFFAVKTCSSHLRCDAHARLDSGLICGQRRLAEYGIQYASFRGIPYAQQPEGELRFKELQPVKPWNHLLDATKEGPVCPQLDVLYGRLVNPYRRMSESCIYANVHVPMEALVAANHHNIYKRPRKGLPIFVFIHGGGFEAGSGDTDLHGPEYLISKGIIVITFNYRLNVFGFLSLNSSKIPGNNGLRDQVTLLRWVQRNAAAFGGNSNDVTLAGQSAGAASAHLLSLSNAAQGLFKRVILMSGTAIPTFYTSSPVYASSAATRFLSILEINATDPDLIHDQLVKMPLDKILNANNVYQEESGLIAFMPVVEPEYPGITRIIEDNPLNLIQQGRGKHLPILIGFTNKECESFRKRLENIDILGRIEKNPLVILPGEIPFSTTPNVALDLANMVVDRYFDKKPTINKYIHACTDTFFAYPAFKMAEWRAEMNAAPVFLYQFSYESDYNVVKDALDLQYKGSAHGEDLTFIFRENAILGRQRSFPPRNRDDLMKSWMTQFVVNFIRCNAPTCNMPGWLPVYTGLLNYQDIHDPAVYCNSAAKPEQRDMIKFFDEIYRISRNSSVNALPTTSPKGEINDTTTERGESYSIETVDNNYSSATTELSESEYLIAKAMEITTPSPSLVKEEGELRVNTVEIKTGEIDPVTKDDDLVNTIVIGSE